MRNTPSLIGDFSLADRLLAALVWGAVGIAAVATNRHSAAGATVIP